jgi:hypothetical protein
MPLHSPPIKQTGASGNTDETGRTHPAAATPDKHQTSSQQHPLPSNNNIDSPATLLSRRIRQKQLKLQALREHASTSPSHFAEEPRSPPPGRIPTTRPPSWSAKVPNSTTERQQSLTPRPSLLGDPKGSAKIFHSPGSTSRERPCTDPKPWGRAVTSGFDPERCRALQIERAAAQATSMEALEIETKIKRLDKLPSLKASPEAARALSALARNHEPKPSPLPQHFTFPRQSLSTTVGGKNVSTKKSTDSTSSVNKDSASPFEYPTTPRRGLFMYLLIIVVTMVLLVSPDPLGEIIQGYHVLNSSFWSLIKFGKKVHQHSIPWMQIAASQCQATLQETYILCSHIWIAFHATFVEIKTQHMDRRANLMKEAAVELNGEDDRRGMPGYEYSSSSIRDGGRPWMINKRSQMSSKNATRTFHSSFGDKRGMNEKHVSFDRYERLPIGDDCLYSTHDLRPEELVQYDRLHTPGWPTIGATSFVDTSWLADIGNHTICNHESSRGWGNITLPCSVENALSSAPDVDPINSELSEPLELSSNVSKSNLNSSHIGLTYLDTPENEVVQEWFDRAIDSCNFQVGQLLQALRNDRIRGIGGLVRGANLITLGSASDVSSIA